MKRIYVIIMLAVFALASANGQTRKEKKAVRQAEQDSIQQLDYAIALLAIQDTMLILEATEAYDRRGNMVMVDGGLNFVKFEKEEGVVQLALPFLMGPNGVGGITLAGKLTNYEVTEDKKGRISIKAFTHGGSLTADIHITMNLNSNEAEATVSSATLPYRVRFTGKINHINNSNHYEGMSRF